MARPSADPYEGLEDREVLARAARALRRVNALPLGSVERAIQWSVYDSAKAELDRRAFLHVVAALRDAQDGPAS